jgi:hypothetical protein
MSLPYSYLFDEGRWEDWFSLFSDDVVFETTTPTIGTLIIKGKKPFRGIVEPIERRNNLAMASWPILAGPRHTTTMPAAVRGRLAIVRN